MDRRVTPSKRVTSRIWDPPPPYKQALRLYLSFNYFSETKLFKLGVHHYPSVQRRENIVSELYYVLVASFSAIMRFRFKD